MPADGNCIGVIQIQDYITVAKITWTRKGNFLHRIILPSSAKRFRFYLQSNTDNPTPLPTQITVYELPTAPDTEN